MAAPSPRPNRSSHTGRALAVGTVLALLAGITGPTMTAAAAERPTARPLADVGSPAGDASTADSTHTVTLVTGDRVHVDRMAGGGRQAAIVEPGIGREQLTFHQFEDGGELLVVPEDVLGALGTGRVDRALFDVNLLIEQGYDDAATDELPLIVRYTDGTDPAVAGVAAGAEAAETGPVLHSINGQALSADKEHIGELWEALAGPTVQGRTALGDGTIEQIRLDRVVEPVLDRSVGQIGADVAWDAGFDGEGVDVAVLDTGIDADHPDLAGVVVDSANFTDSPTTGDAVGHGTHVAATVAGTGNASPADRKGVAPAAGVLNGKVLGDDGRGWESWVLAGMEWAAESGAPIVNLSLGSGPTDGTDPLSLGLDALSEEYGTLFVVSAGNDGRFGESTIGSPGSATRALTVGAVDRDESLAEFSSRGPRLRDFALKPNVTAPGVGIVAARADGTTIGDPLDEHYAALSGTSMAAPHVAGAAALLAQRYPEWDGRELADALASTTTGNDDLTVYEQGTGRIDLERAIDQGVYGTGTLDLGVYADNLEVEAAQRALAETGLSYTNVLDEPIELELDLHLTTPAGDVAGDRVRLGTDRITVEPGETVSVPVEVDPDGLEHGLYGGQVIATGIGDHADVRIATATGLLMDVPRYEVEFETRGLDGELDTVTPLIFVGEDGRFDFVGDLWPAIQPWKHVVGEGTYYVRAVFSGGSGPDHTTYIVEDPAFEVTGDQTIVMDARTATSRVRIETPEPAAQDGIFNFYGSREFDTRRFTHTQMHFDYVEGLTVSPSPTVADGVGSYEFGSRWQYVKPRFTVTAPGRDRFQPELHPLWFAPVVDGTDRMPMVDVGAGTPADYERVDASGKVALIWSESGDYFDSLRLIEHATAAEVAFALIVVPPGGSHFTKWNPKSLDRAEIPGALVPHEDGVRLRPHADGRVRLTVEQARSSPYLYDIMQTTPGGIPDDDIVHRVSTRNAAVLSTRYHATGTEWQKEQRFGWRPWQTTAALQYQRIVPTGVDRVEYVTAGDTTWQHRVKGYYSWESMNPLLGGMTAAPRSYRAGEQLTERWFAPVLRPVIPTGVEGAVSYREGDRLLLQIPEWGDARPGHYGHREGDFAFSDTTSATLYADDEPIAEASRAMGWFQAAEPADARYRLELDVERDWDEWHFGTRSQTSWEFGAPPSTEPAPLPLLQVDYDVATGTDSRVAAGRAQEFEIAIRHQDGLDDPRVERFEVWASYDDGDSWVEPAWVRPIDDGRNRVRLQLPTLDETNGFVGLRVRAVDSGQNVVDQRVQRAWGLR